MGRYTGPRNKLSRREAADLFGTGGDSLRRRQGQPPGQHGAPSHGARPQRTRPSVFSLQLREKQKLKRIYGMRERQFRRFVDLARRESERTGTALLRLLERRLDNVVYRLGFARSRAMARQLVVHGHVLLNGRKADVPSLLVEPGMEIGLGSTARSMPDVRWAMEEPVLTLPGWLSRDNGSGRVIDWPAADELEHDVQDELIVEFYSR